MSRRAPALIALGAVVLASGCESTQSRSEKLVRQGSGAFGARGLDVKQRNPDVEVAGRWVLQDENGTAVVLRLRNRSARGLARVPLEVDVTGKGGRVLFENDEPGLEPALVEAPTIPPKGEFTWVNDQIVASGRARGVKVEVGKEKRELPRRLPEFSLSQVKYREDPVDGLQVAGVIKNRSDVPQRKIGIYCVSRRGGEVVAAGRAQVERLKARGRARFQLFFIGDPKRGKLDFSVPPTVLDKKEA